MHYTALKQCSFATEVCAHRNLGLRDNLRLVQKPMIALDRSQTQQWGSNADHAGCLC